MAPKLASNGGQLQQLTEEEDIDPLVVTTSGLNGRGPLGDTSSGQEEQDPPVDSTGGGEQLMVTSSVAPGGVSWKP